MTDERFPRPRRVRRQADFDRIYAEDAFAADDVLVIRGCRNDVGHLRLGLSISRKVGPAVLRNRWKRLIREAFRRQATGLDAAVDLVIRPRRGACPDYHRIAESLPRLTRRICRRLAGAGRRTEAN